jgi:hypothetical protein
LILFSHGWNGFAAQNSGQAIELASYGYIVVAVQHTYGAVVTVFPNGETIYNNPEALPSVASDEDYSISAQKLGQQWANDLSYTLDYLEIQNISTDSFFYASLDISTVGVFGHSTGGGAAIQFCGSDNRCRSLLGQDPYLLPVSDEVIQNGNNIPSFFLFSETFGHEESWQRYQVLKQHSPNSLGDVTILGTAHYDFTDLPLLSPIAPQLGIKGPLNGERVFTIVKTYLLAFFDLTLKGINYELLLGPSQDFPEIHFNN